MQRDFSLGDVLHHIIDYSEGMFVGEKELNVVISSSHLADPFVVVVNPAVVPFDVK
jgi:hypothetical protein